MANVNFAVRPTARHTAKIVAHGNKRCLPCACIKAHGKLDAADAIVDVRSLCRAP